MQTNRGAMKNMYIYPKRQTENLKDDPNPKRQSHCITEKQTHTYNQTNIPPKQTNIPPKQTNIPPKQTNIHQTDKRTHKQTNRHKNRQNHTKYRLMMERENKNPRYWNKHMQ